MKTQRLLLLVVVILEWFALIAQLIIHLETIELPLAESLVRFFSYFTILTNLLVSIYTTYILFSITKGGSDKSKLTQSKLTQGKLTQGKLTQSEMNQRGLNQSRTGFFFRPAVQTAITLYITVVGLVYNIILRHLWDSEGMQAIIHDLLHTIIPLLVIIYWWIWTPTKKLEFKNIPAWLIYPAIYAIAVMVSGNFINWYPYPFLDLGKLGIQQVLFNSAMLILVFVFFSFLFVMIGTRKKQPQFNNAIENLP